MDDYKEENNIILIESDEAYQGERLDRYLSVKLPEYSRSFLQKLIKEERIRVNGTISKANYRIDKKDSIEISLPELKELEIPAEDIPLNILYEDQDIIVINKEKNMVVHPAAGHRTGTLVNALLYHCGENLSGINGVVRPGIVHRIDRNTTGVLVVCKNDTAHQALASQLKEHSITRKYYALVYRSFQEEEGTVNAPIGRHPTDRKKMAIHPNGKQAITHYKVLENLTGNYAFLECQLETGRTHQIRVHLSSIGHPLLGDEVYGFSKNPFHLEGQALHAAVLGFLHPSTKEYMEFSAPLPEYFQNLLSKLRKGQKG